eukprot:11169980-Ditylum_brightwellii.AAC.1
MKDTRSIAVMKKLVAVSGPKVFSLKESPQYKAACWVLYEDPMRTTVSDKSPNLVQRYVVRLFLALIEGDSTVSDDVNEFGKRHECLWWKDDDGVECSKNEIRKFWLRGELFLRWNNSFKYSSNGSKGCSP